MSSKSLEELLGILQTSEDVVEHLPSEIEQFIAFMEIEPSDTEKVHARIIFWKYMQWKIKGCGTDEVLSRIEFFRQFSKRFKRGKDKLRFYRIKKNRFMLSRWEREEIQNDLQLERKQHLWLRQKRKKEM